MESVRICLVEPLEKDSTITAAAQKLKKEKNVPFVFSSCGTEFLNDPSTYFVVSEFDGPVFENLHRHQAKILGPAALILVSNGDERINLPALRRPLFCLAMDGVNVCFTGYRTQPDHMNRLSRLIYHMGGRVRREMHTGTTHLIAHHPGGEKYDYADTFKIPILKDSWVLSAWELRHNPEFSATENEMVTEHNLKLGGTRICFLGFSAEDTSTYNDYLIKNNGQVSSPGDPLCTHLVVNDKGEPLPILPENIPTSCYVVRSEWWWTTMENESYVEVKEYLMQNHDTLHGSTPCTASSRAKKRKRLQQLAGYSGSPAGSKRRSGSVTLDYSGNYLDWTLTPDKDANDGLREPKPASPRQLKFLELVSTETNYVGIISSIITIFKTPLEDLKRTKRIGKEISETEELQSLNADKENTVSKEDAVNPILDGMEIKLIFGNLPPILDVHAAMLEELKAGAASWNTNFSIGEIILKRAVELQKAYPPFINNYEKSIETLELCEKYNPRFHAFLKLRQSLPECGRQTLKELLIRPVQRLPSISLLLSDLLKHTDESHPDHIPLKSALASIKEVTTHINEDKRRTEAQVAILELFNQIENCPPDLVSSHRNLILKCDCLETTDGRKGDPVTLLLFTDTLEICCQRRMKNFTLRGTRSLQKIPKSKPYKHLRHVMLKDLRHVYSLIDLEEYRHSFMLEGYFGDDSLKHVTFSVVDDIVTMEKFVEVLARQIADTLGIRDWTEVLKSLDKLPSLEEAPKSSTSSLSRAFKFASSAKTKMGRALSLTRTPSRVSRILPRRTDSTCSDHSPGLARRFESGANLNDSFVSLNSFV